MRPLFFNPIHDSLSLGYNQIIPHYSRIDDATGNYYREKPKSRLRSYLAELSDQQPLHMANITELTVKGVSVDSELADRVGIRWLFRTGTFMEAVHEAQEDCYSAFVYHFPGLKKIIFEFSGTNWNYRKRNPYSFYRDEEHMVASWEYAMKKFLEMTKWSFTSGKAPTVVVKRWGSDA